MARWSISYHCNRRSDQRYTPAQIFQRQNKSQSYKQLTIGGPRCSNSRIADQFLKKQFAESSKEKASI